MEAVHREAVDREAVDREIISEVTQEHHQDLQKYLLKDVKELATENEVNMNRAGAYGNVINLEWNGRKLAGKVLHSIFFTRGTEPSGMRKMLTRFFAEIKLLSKMEHPNIVEFVGIYYREHHSLLPVLVMEKMECNLDQYLIKRKKGSISEDRILGILLDVSRGLVYLHEEMKVAHRDLSSNNILLTAKLNAKIADLGSARVLDRPGGWVSHAQLTVNPGTLDFMPPEALEDPPKYTVSVDVFSFGCVTIHLCTHKWPSPIGKTDQGKIMSEYERRQKYISEISLLYLLPHIKHCLEDQSAKRPTSRYLMSILEAKIAKSVDYTIVISGITGMGKSTAGNFFLNKEVFPTAGGFDYCTEVCLVSTSIIHGKKVKIIDTPGFFDEFSSTEANFREFSRVLTLAKDGIHAVAFVMSYGRFTKACREAIQQLQQLKGVQTYVFVLLTNTKKNGITPAATAEYIDECLTSNRCSPGLRTLMQMVGKRVVMLEAIDFISENYHEQKCSELLMMIEGIYKSNGNKVYTDVLLQHAAEVYEQAKAQQQEEIQETAKSLESNSQKILQLKQQIKENTDNKVVAQKINKEITALQKENDDLEKRLGEIIDEQYLVQLTNKILENEISQADAKGMGFANFILSVAGGIIGGAIGSLAGGTPVGVGVGAAIGGAAAKLCRLQ